MSYLLYNAIKTPDGTILWCQNRHDFKTYFDTISKETYMNDGGGYYCRRSVNKVPYEDLSVYTTDPFEIVRQAKFWGSYGKDGKQPKVILSLAEMETEHIEAILKNAFPSEEVKPLFVQELKYRTTLTSKIKP